VICFCKGCRQPRRPYPVGAPVLRS
jgi:hypothetical protein